MTTVDPLRLLDASIDVGFFPSSFQVPTPPRSVTDSPIPLADGGGGGSSVVLAPGVASPTSVSVSTTFFPNAPIDVSPADVLLVTADGVWFYLHSHRLLSASDNGFAGLLPGPVLNSSPVPVPERSPVLNLVAHAVYGLPFAHYSPSFDDLSDAVDALDRYGALRLGLVAPATPMYEALLTHAPLRPFEVYKLAGAHGLDGLAVASSAYLHSLALSSLTDDDASQMGAVYLRRLFFLHLGRTEALKRLLLTGPTGHASTPSCNFAAQTAVTRAWALAAAYLSWEARADISASQLSGAMTSLEEGLRCPQCRMALRDRVKQLLLQWSLVKATI